MRNRRLARWRSMTILAALLLAALVFSQAGPPAAEAQSTPGAPRFVVAVVGNGFLQVSWMGVIGATKYDVDYSSNGGSSWSSAVSNLGPSGVFAEQYRINGTDNYSAYVARVRAGNGNGSSGWTVSNSAGPWSDPEEPVVTIPEPKDPPRLSFPHVTATTAQILFGDGGAWSYHKQFNLGSCQSVSAGQSIASLTGLSTGTRYTYFAYDSSNCTGRAVNGSFTTLTPALASSNVTRTTATLTLTGWVPGKDGSWHYKHTNTGATCSSDAVTTGSVDLTGLKKGTSYTYEAYSDSGCSTKIATASAFTTLGSSLTVSNVTSSSATLNLSNYTGTWYSRRIHPDTTLCSVGVTGATQNRDSLTSNTTYAYTAYSDSNCTADNALDTAYFSTTDAAVGNLKEARESSDWTVGGSTDIKYATAFTTGAQAHGYNLTSLTLDFAARTSAPGDISVALHAAATNGTDPAATASATLSGSDPDAAGLQTYTCSTGCDLSASTTYFIVTSVPTGASGGSYNQRNTASDDETLQDAAGWSIANAGRSKTGAAAWAAAASSASMHVAANVKPASLTASSITSTTATLTIANHTGNWYHKETFPSTTATCSTANSGSTAALGSLTADKTYAYTAYSNSTCTDANALDTAYFSTTDDGVGNLNEEPDFNITVGGEAATTSP